jgi:hypothetical protein
VGNKDGFLNFNFLRKNRGTRSPKIGSSKLGGQSSNGDEAYILSRETAGCGRNRGPARGGR